MQNYWLIFWSGALVYLTGGILYGCRIPERFHPGKYDLCGASHQLMHIAVIVGCCITFYSNLLIFKSAQIFECPVAADLAQATPNLL